MCMFLKSCFSILDKKISSEIREQLGIFNINKKLMQYKINWRNIYKEWMTTDCPQKIKLQT